MSKDEANKKALDADYRPLPGTDNRTVAYPEQAPNFKPSYTRPRPTLPYRTK